MKQILILSILLFAVVVLAQAQDKNPYSQFGYEGKVLKIPQGNYGTLRITAPKKDADYQPFGMTKTQGVTTSGGYRYGFQGQEKDDELKGGGNSVNYKYRMHDTRLGRFFAVDPLSSSFPWNSNYAFSENRVLDAIELEGLEAHVLTQNYNSDGEFESSTFAWDETANPVKNGEIHYVKNEGDKSTRSVVKSSSVNYEGGDIKPTPAPSTILGETDYYTFRDNDFNLRQTLMDDIWSLQPSSPKYYLEYGDKYINRFTAELYSDLSPQGQVWLEEALLNLQLAIEIELAKSPSIEVNNKKFQRFAFDSHVDAYEDAGLFDLRVTDLIKIGLTPDIMDLVSPNGLRQAKTVGQDYIQDVKERPVHATTKVINFGLFIYKNYYDSDSDEGF